MSMPLVCIITRIQHLVPLVVVCGVFFLTILKPYISGRERERESEWKIETGNTLLQANEPNKKSGIRLFMRECIMCELWALYLAALSFSNTLLRLVCSMYVRVFFSFVPFFLGCIWKQQQQQHWSDDDDFCLNWVIRKALERYTWKWNEMNWRWYL